MAPHQMHRPMHPWAFAITERLSLWCWRMSERFHEWHRALALCPDCGGRRDGPACH